MASTPSSEDLLLWQKSTQRVTPLKQPLRHQPTQNVLSLSPRQLPTSASPLPYSAACSLPETTSCSPPLFPPTIPPPLPSPVNITRRERKKLRREEPEHAVDLHGYRSQQALELLDAQIHWAQSRGLRVVTVVHGRGKNSAQAPVLKPLVRGYLCNHPAVISMTEEEHGGALRLRLRKTT